MSERREEEAASDTPGAAKPRRKGARLLPFKGVVGERARPVRCQDCRKVVLAAHVDGFLRKFEPGNLSPEGELDCILSGRATFTDADAYVFQREPSHILSQPARTWPVLALHICGAPPLLTRADNKVHTRGTKHIPF